ncbi:hypothetical protein N180_03520 [Pedobacter antarcticus 4BY]|uniref:Uncharacterized protein n=2 Tax=Pedobacter antarcticus TaxID=34086 RepID=A0A081PFG6_9SPHI|nr:DUF6266 family protein [Pedobacter antarcticus]KEQ29439.1 hypothetical protein N180_03520 [Pedobacter antarcticus 4BY]SFF12300.1 hypothetical protein SAMN03003324_02494 [Pedobacter antarcticus]
MLFKKRIKRSTKDPNRTIEYCLNNKGVKRRAGERTAPITDQEKSGQRAIVIVSTFMSHLKFFIRKGFELEARKNGQVPHNIAKAQNHSLIISGKYPTLTIDYSKALLTVGQMRMAPNMHAELHIAGILFKWDYDANIPGCKPDDQVMLVAYFPEKGYGIELLNGEKRHKGEHLLELPASVNLTEVHTYMSFISADHGSISNSTYLGQFDWQTPLTP